MNTATATLSVRAKRHVYVQRGIDNEKNKNVYLANPKWISRMKGVSNNHLTPDCHLLIILYKILDTYKKIYKFLRSSTLTVSSLTFRSKNTHYDTHSLTR